MPDTDRALITALVVSHGAQLRRYLSQRVRNSSDVADLAQEVFLRMLRLPDHESIRSPEAYLFTVAQHVAYQHAVRRAHAESRAGLHAMLTLLAEACNDPVGEISAEELAEAMEKALQRLAPRERDTFLYHRRDGLTLKEIADHLGVSRQMVKKYLAKAVLALRGHAGDMA